MSERFVADSSIAIGWIHPNQSTELTKRLLEEVKHGSAVCVPPLWHLEVANGLLVAVRRKLLTEAHRQNGLALLSSLRVIVDEETSKQAFSTTSDLAVRYTLSIYDACYLELARRKALPLASRDESLRSAAMKCGVKCLE